MKAERSNDIRAWFNGRLLEATEHEGEFYENVYDISRYVRCGMNEYTVEVNWHEHDSVYYALYGENVTESLRNCIVYDSELQPIQVLGDFGVYTKTGYSETEHGYVEAEHFYIGEVPEKVTDPTVDGFPFFAGEMTVSQKIILDREDILLQIEGEYQMAAVTVNGMDKGLLLFEKGMDISDVARVGENEIQIRFWISNRNLMGPHHLKGSKRENVSPWSFEMYDAWDEDENVHYHATYDLKLFYK